MQVEVAFDHWGESDCHKAGCRDLSNMRKYPDQSRRVIYEVSSKDDVIYEEWGASGVASDNYPGKIYDEGYRAYRVEEYSSCTRFFPCVDRLPQS